MKKEILIKLELEIEVWRHVEDIPESPASLMKTLDDFPPCWYNENITGVPMVCVVVAVEVTAVAPPFLNKTVYVD